MLSPHASATLLDPETGYAACVASDALSGQTGLLLAVEATGYEGDPTERSVFLYKTAVSRLKHLRDTASALARPLTGFYPAGEGDDLEGWYK